MRKKHTVVANLNNQQQSRKSTAAFCHTVHYDTVAIAGTVLYCIIRHGQSSFQFT